MTLVIRGAGIAGLVTAHELVNRGFSVEVHERAGAVGHGASHFAGGMLAPYCEREAAPDLVLQIGLRGLDWWRKKMPADVISKGTLVLAQPRDMPELSRFATRTQGYEWVDAEAIAALEPDLAGRFHKGLFFADEAHLDPRRAMRRLYEDLEKRGTVFRLSCDKTMTPSALHGTGTGAGTGTGDGGHGNAGNCIIDCTGAAAIGALPGLRGVRGEMLYLHTPDITLSRPVRLLHPRHPLYVVPRGNDLFMLGATMIEAADSGPIAVRSLMELLNMAFAVHPAFGEARVTETGTGIRPALVDNVPRVVETPEGLAVAGMYRHGFLLAPAMAQEVADRLEQRHTNRERKFA
ncbi:glycine oxidase ThiO [Rhizobium sp. 18065]|uniref:glycine oxidase ThiO n=1 Tax=Rhizobium sp. 18065 TaxID=2681411 RepID=UPI00135CEB8B|nr:glycine oxidase ThiO [Rhizobium sp. 18065]